MIVKIYELSCDNCGIGEHPSSNNIFGVEYWAKNHGWVVTGEYKHKHYCSEKCYGEKLTNPNCWKEKLMDKPNHAH